MLSVNVIAPMSHGRHRTTQKEFYSGTVSVAEYIIHGGDVVTFLEDENATLPHVGASNSGPWEDAPMRGGIAF